MVWVISLWRQNLFLRLGLFRASFSPSNVPVTPDVQRQEAQTQAVLWSEIAWIWRYTANVTAALECNTRAQEVLHQASPGQ